MKYKVQSIISNIERTPSGEYIMDQQILSVRRDILDELRQEIFRKADETETILTYVATKNK